MQIQTEIRRVVTGYIDGKQRDSSIVCGLDDVRRIDGRQRWSKRALASARVHDPDFTVFSHITDPDSFVLDVGAHFGYSAASIWASGCAAKVFSFEANPLYTRALQSLRDVRGVQFDFRSIGLNDTVSTSTFIVPILNYQLLGAFCTMDEQPSVESLIRHSLSFYNAYFQNEPFQFYRLYHFSAETKPLDDLLQEADIAATVTRIAAIKVDVEGLEARVLRGAQVTLQTHKPLVLAERGRSRAILNEFMAGQGYCFALRDGASLICTTLPSKGLNQFFVHKSRLQDYVNLGIVRANRSPNALAQL